MTNGKRRCLVILTMLFWGMGTIGCANQNGGMSMSHSMVASVADDTFLESFAATRRFSLGHPTAITVTPDGREVLFLRSGPRSFVRDLYSFDVATGEENKILTSEKILEGAVEELSIQERARRERMRMTARGIATYRLSQDGKQILVPLSGRLFVVDRQTQKVKELESEAGFPIDPKFSPDGKHISCVRDGEVYVIDLASGVERKLTTGAGGTITNGLSEFVAQEEMGRFSGYWWSPDSRFIAYQQTDVAQVETFYIADAAHPSRSPHTWPYPRPGKNNAQVKLAVMPIDGGDSVWVRWDAEAYPYLASVRWSPKAPLTILVQNRKQTEELLLAIDSNSGESNTLLVEKDDAWINLDQSMPYWMPDGQRFLWTTERGGAWQLELRGRSGQLIKILTSLEFNFKRFLHYNQTQEQLYLSGTDDPIQSHVYRMSLNDTESLPTRLSKADGLHGASFAKDNHCEVYVHSESLTDGSHRQTVRTLDGRKLGELKSVAEAPPFTPHVEFVTVDHKQKFRAAIIRPRNFHKGRKYPVIVYVYGGPHAQTVQANPNNYLLQQWLADHGFIIVTMDARGTPSRGRAWERVIKNNVIDIPLNDQVEGLQSLGKKYAELDMSRVGIYGWSFGGYFSAMAVMQRPDIYKAGVSGAPVCDWLDYDTHYTERYMGLPDENEFGYEASSVLSHTSKLSRPLLIIHGTADDNVYFMHSLKMSNELFRAGKTHDFLPLSDFTHMVADPNVTKQINRRIVGYFMKHLQ